LHDVLQHGAASSVEPVPGVRLPRFDDPEGFSLG
jgi:hypothetical protein